MIDPADRHPDGAPDVEVTAKLTAVALVRARLTDPDGWTQGIIEYLRATVDDAAVDDADALSFLVQGLVGFAAFETEEAAWKARLMHGEDVAAMLDRHESYWLAALTPASGS